MNNFIFRTSELKSRKSLKTQYTSIGGGLTNIRPSHFFINIPRNSIAYKVSDMTRKGFKDVPRTAYSTASHRGMDAAKTLTNFHTQVTKFKGNNLCLLTFCNRFGSKGATVISFSEKTGSAAAFEKPKRIHATQKVNLLRKSKNEILDQQVERWHCSSNYSI